MCARTQAAMGSGEYLQTQTYSVRRVGGFGVASAGNAQTDNQLLSLPLPHQPGSAEPGLAHCPASLALLSQVWLFEG